MKVGMSLSLCVLDIMEGQVQLEDVAFIYSGTCCRDMRDWGIVLDTYSSIYWNDNPKGEEIALHFINHNLIIQPRLEGKVVRVRLHRLPKWIEQTEFNEFVKANLEAD